MATATGVAADGDLGFTYRATAKGVVHIARDGREVVTLRTATYLLWIAVALELVLTPVDFDGGGQEYVSR